MVRQDDTLRISDHLPVIARFLLPPPPSNGIAPAALEFTTWKTHENLVDVQGHRRLCP